MRERRRRANEFQARALDLPPVFRSVVLRAADDAFVHACQRAKALGAGTLVFADRCDCVEFAVVLEPDEPLARGRLVLYAGMIALHDALAAAAPPEKPITIVWPDALHVDGGLVGGGRLAWPNEAGADGVPDWLVFGARLRIAAPSAQSWPHRHATALAEEGFVDLAAIDIAESFARHVMAALDRWHEGGLAAIVGPYLAALALAKDTQRQIAENGDLLVPRPNGGIDRHDLSAALRSPSWLDPQTGEPRL